MCCPYSRNADNSSSDGRVTVDTIPAVNLSHGIPSAFVRRVTDE
jgi:hypothetical protein